MLVEGKSISIRWISLSTPSPNQSSQRRGGELPKPGATSNTPRFVNAPIEIILRISGCDYFIADGPNGYYVLEWYGGYDPDQGDGIYGEIRSYGFKDVIYGNGREGRIYVDDYALSKSRALEILRSKCR